MKKLPQISEAEYQVMKVVWKHAPINTKEVIDLGRKSGGTVHFIIEQESYQGMAPLDCAKEDLVIMKKWGY